MKQVMYLGPNIKGIVRKNQIFTYDPEKVIVQACKVSPLARDLFVPMDDIVQVRNELRREGSFLNIAYRKVKKEVNDGRL